MLKKIAALLLACVMLLVTVGCAGSGDTGKETSGFASTSAPDETTEPPETEDTFYQDRNNAKDSLPDQLDFGDADLRVLYFDGVDVWGDSTAAYEFFTDSENAVGSIQTIVVKRNAIVEDRLKVKIKALSGEDIGDKLRTSVMSFSDDYDLYASGGVISAASEGFLTDLLSVEYLDLDQPWWNDAYNNSLTIDNRLFSTTGELSITLLAYNYVTFFNKAIWNDYYPDTDLYQVIRNGEFTLERFAEYCNGIYRDLNQDGIANVDDLYGNVSAWETKQAAAWGAGSHVNYATYDTDNNVFLYTFHNDHNAAFLDKMSTILWRDNRTYASANNEMDLDVQLMAKLKNDTVLFTLAKMTCVEFLRDMDNDFGIVPLPKFDEAQENYSTTPQPGFTGFGIVTTSPNPDMVGAFMEAAAAENYRIVTPTYFDSAVKYGFTRDEESAEMLDVCVEGIYFDYALAVGGWGSAILSSLFTTEKQFNTILRYADKNQKHFEASMNEILDKIRAVE